MKCKQIYSSPFCRQWHLLVLLLPVFFSCKKKQELFTLVPSTVTNVHFVNKTTDSTRLNFLDYLYYYNGGGVAAADFNNDGFTDIYFTSNSKGGNKLYLNKGNFVFEDITTLAGVAGISDWCTGVSVADVNADGLADIYVCAVAGKLTLQGHNQLFINKGNNRFVDEAEKYGLNFSGFSVQACFFDYDKDGDLDCYLLNQSMHSTETYGDTSMRRKPSPAAGDRLYRNNGGHFENVSTEAGIYSSALGYGLGVAVADMNNDGWDDIYVGNDFHENDYYYVNNGNGTFTESGAAVFGHYSRFSMGNDVADYNNDGQPDIFTCDMLPHTEKILKTYASDDDPDIYDFKIGQNGFQNQYSQNCLQKNAGNGKRFSEVAFLSKVAATDWSWCPLFADFDNDGIKDLFISNGIAKRPADLDYIKFISDAQIKTQLNNGRAVDAEVLNQMPEGKAANFIFKGNADEIFSDETVNWGLNRAGLSNGAAYADLNNDGALDLIVNNLNEEAFIYRNNAAPKTYINFVFEGMQGNTAGFGTKVYLFTKAGLQYQQLYPARGFQSSSQPLLHFGIDTLRKVDSVLVVWPDFNYQVLKTVPVNQTVILNHHLAAGIFAYNRYFPEPPRLFTDITTAAGIHYTHRENNYNDYNEQYFIPHKVSTQGPGLAVADVNGDELDDFFVCAAKGSKGQMYIQTKQGTFIQQPFLQDSSAEQVAALLDDFDGDGDNDLYIVTGGNEEEGNSKTLADHLYFNNGKGVFTESDRLPLFYGNKSAVCAADIDGDGDKDLFVAGRVVAKAYGKIPASFVLINNGSKGFAIDTLQWGKELHDAGMITGAVFADMNNDHKPDLIVAGEWMPVTCYMNTGSGFSIKYADEKLKGWWQSITVNDVNGDGFMDIVAGNFGVNSKLTPPVKLYLKDIDANGQTDPVLSVTDPLSKLEYPFLLKDELEKQLPYLKKEFLHYRKFAGKTITQIWGNKLQGADVLQANVFESMIFLNNQKGGFTVKSLPLSLQTAPLFAIEPVLLQNQVQFLFGGNFFGAIPYEGRYDALVPGLYSFTTGKLTSCNELNVLTGEIRSIKKIKLAGNRKGVLLASNNNLLKLLEY